MDHDHTQPATARPVTNPRIGGKMRHRLMMIACCIPMLLIALGLVFAGVVSTSFLIFVVICTAMMALMMGGMHGGNK